MEHLGEVLAVDDGARAAGFEGWLGSVASRKVDVRLPGKGNSKLPWRKAGPPNHLDDKVDSDQ